MQNIYISEIFKKISKLLELHQKNIFITNKYKKAAHDVKILDIELYKLSFEQIKKINIFSKTIHENIIEILEHGKLNILDNLLKITPKGVVEMFNINGLGPKKINMIWKGLNIITIEDLESACEKRKISLIKGFGVKTEALILENIKFYKNNQDKHLYSKVLESVFLLKNSIQSQFKDIIFSITGDLRRKREIIEEVEVLLGCDITNEIQNFLNDLSFIKGTQSDDTEWKGVFIGLNIGLKIHLTSKKNFYKRLIITTGSTNHINKLLSKYSLHENLDDIEVRTEEDFYKKLNIQYIPAELRENCNELMLAENYQIPKLIERKDIKGILHVHTTYSDGVHSLRDIVEYCNNRGYSYLGISDHSKSAGYAGGLQESQVLKQHEEIEKLNEEFYPFKILKGIESDVLIDGALDYRDEVLEKFDFVIASIHSGMRMDIKKATNRLVTAIQNPYTTILGHPTGRLLLKRDGYPLDFDIIFEECAKHKVIIEINANPNRLDLDWRLLGQAKERGVKISINPDAHSKETIEDIDYGLNVAKKGMLTKKDVINSYELKELYQFLKKYK